MKPSKKLLKTAVLLPFFLFFTTPAKPQVAQAIDMITLISKKIKVMAKYAEKAKRYTDIVRFYGIYAHEYKLIVQTYNQLLKVSMSNSCTNVEDLSDIVDNAYSILTGASNTLDACSAIMEEATEILTSYEDLTGSGSTANDANMISNIYNVHDQNVQRLRDIRKELSTQIQVIAHLCAGNALKGGVEKTQESLTFKHF